MRSSFCSTCGDEQYRSKYNVYRCNDCLVKERATTTVEKNSLEYALEMLNEAKESTNRAMLRLGSQPELNPTSKRLVKGGLQAACSYATDAIDHLNAAIVAIDEVGTDEQS